jgi:hypothetical protein
MSDKFQKYRDQMRITNALVREHFPRIKPATDAFCYYSELYHKFCFKVSMRVDQSSFSWMGNADNGYDARVKGWQAFLKEKGIDY